MSITIEPAIRELAESVIDAGTNKRAIAVLKVLLDRGRISTDEIQDMGYNHPPRAIGDVRDTGIPIITGSSVSERSGRRMAVYSFGQARDIQSGRIGGRSALPKSFKRALISTYGSIDCITGAELDERVLQIDHRIPYRIAGDTGLSDHDVEAYMLLDASSQRSKSWSCENCPNMLPENRNADICGSCFWAFPESYRHIAMQQIRRTEIVWQNDQASTYDELKALAEKEGHTVSDLIKSLADEYVAKTARKNAT